MYIVNKGTLQYCTQGDTMYVYYTQRDTKNVYSTQGDTMNVYCTQGDTMYVYYTQRDATYIVCTLYTKGRYVYCMYIVHKGTLRILYVHCTQRDAI